MSNLLSIFGSPYFWLALTLLGLAQLAYVLYKSAGAWRKHARLNKNGIIYQEKRASGYSNKSLLTQHGGVRDKLHLRVTPDALHVSLPLMLSPLASFYDLEHHVPLENITAVTPVPAKPDVIELAYRDENDAHHSLRLRPQNLQDFLAAIKRTDYLN